MFMGVTLTISPSLVSYQNSLRVHVPLRAPGVILLLLPRPGCPLPLFPCEAVRTDDSDNQQVIDPVLFRNSHSMDIYFPPPRHRAWANHEGNVVGIEVNPTTLVDSGSTYQCVIMENNRTSKRTTLYVGGEFPVHDGYNYMVMLWARAVAIATKIVDDTWPSAVADSCFIARLCLQHQ